MPATVAAFESIWMRGHCFAIGGRSLAGQVLRPTLRQVWGVHREPMCASADGGLGDGTIPAHRSAGYGSSVAPRHAPGLCSDFGKTLPPRWYRSKLTPACGEGRSRCFCATSRALSKLVSRCKNPPFCAGPALFGNPCHEATGVGLTPTLAKNPFTLMRTKCGCSENGVQVRVAAVDALAPTAWTVPLPIIEQVALRQPRPADRCTLISEEPRNSLSSDVAQAGTRNL